MTTLDAAQTRFLAGHTARNHSEKHLSHYRATFKDLDRFLTATRRPKTTGVLTTDVMEAFVSWLKDTPLQRPYRGTTRRSIVGIYGHMKDLRAFVRWCAEEDLIDWRVSVPLPKLPKHFYPILSREELATLYESRVLAGQSELAIRNRAIFALLLDTGIRLSECANLTPEDIKYGSHLHVTGKGDRQRVCPFSPEVGALLDRWLAIRATLSPQAGATLFLLLPHGIGQVIERLSEVSGIDVFPHKMRHTACTLMLMRGMDLFTVSKIMGHTSVLTTQGYLSLLPEDLQAKHATASPFAALQETLSARQVAPSPIQRRLKRRESAA